MKKTTQFLLYSFLVATTLAGCKDGLVEETTQDTDIPSGSGADLTNGIIFSDDTMRFTLKPNDQKPLFTVMEQLIDRKTEIPLTAAQIDSLTLELTGANKQFFTLEKTIIDEDNANDFPAGNHWLITFNKAYEYFYDEVQAQCLLGRCNATLIARTATGNEAISRIEIQLIAQDSFSLINGNSITHDANSGNYNYTISSSGVAIENQKNTLYLLPHHLVQGKRLPSTIDIRADLTNDLDGNGFISQAEEIEVHNNNTDAFWQSAILTSQQLQQAKYIFLDESGNPDDRFSLGFEPAASWFDALDETDLIQSYGVFNRQFFFYQRYDAIKAAQYRGLWPVIYFEAPAIAESDRIDLTCTRGNGNSTVATPYYQGQTNHLKLAIVATDTTKPWLYFNITINTLGSDSDDYRYLEDDIVCGANNYSSSNTTKPSLELLLSTTESQD